MTWEKRLELRDAGGNHLVLYKDLISDTIANKAKIDSLIARSNKEIEKDYKEIHITGMLGTIGPMVSVYNEEGIKTAASFDKKMRYTYELAIPLKYLEAAINNTSSFKYTVRLNVLPIVKRQTPAPHTDVVRFSENPPLMSADEMFRFNDTDFSGMYTLASKPTVN